MHPFQQLFSLYPTKPENPQDLHAQEILAPYAELFGITFQNGKIKIGNGDELLNTLSLGHIHAIVDEPDFIYIVLHSSIYVLCKETGEVKIHLKV